MRVNTQNLEYLCNIIDNANDNLNFNNNANEYS